MGCLPTILNNQDIISLLTPKNSNVNLVNRWKKAAIETLPLVFGKSQAKHEKAIEIERNRLYQKVGQLQVELDWLKKTPDIYDDY